MDRMKPVMVVVLVLAGLMSWAGTAQGDPVTVTLTAIADTDIREAVPTYAKGNRDIVMVKNAYAGDWMKGYFKFQLPADFDTASAVEFKLTPALIANPAWALEHNIHGLKDGAVGNDWEDLSPGEIPGQPYTAGLTWENAFANNNTNGETFMIADATGVLGQIISGGSVGVERTTGVTTELVDFVNTDTDGYVTLLMARVNTGTNSADQWASREHATLDPPKLVLTYEPLDLRTATLAAIADTDIRKAAATYAKGDRNVLLAKNAYEHDWMKGYFKFQLPVDMETAVAVEFKLTPSHIANAAWFLEYNIHGLNDSAVGNDWQDLAPGEIPGQPYTDGLTWENAFANDQTSGEDFTADATGPLGQIISGGTVGVERTTSSTPGLVQLINDDTDGYVTLLMARVNTGTNSADQWATREHATLEPPKLVITYQPNDAKTVTVTPTADSDIRQAIYWYAKGNRDYHVCQYSTAYPDRCSKVYLRFDLPGDFDTALGATFKITNHSIYNPLWSWKYNIHGLKDEVVGNDWQDLSPGTIPEGSDYTVGLTWGNAPGHDPNDLNGFNNDATDVLGFFQEQNVGVENEMSSGELVDFINADSDGRVTLMMARVNNSSAGSGFASRESHLYDPPKLELVYLPTCGMQLRSDLYWDCYVTLADLAALGANWMAEDVTRQEGDIHTDGLVDGTDLSVLSSDWLTMCSDQSNPDCDQYWQASLLAPQRWDAWRQSWDDAFPIGSWAYFHRYVGDVAEYTTYADAGLSMVQAPLDHYENAVTAGLKPLVGTWDALYANPETLTEFMNTPSAVDQSLAGYYLKDDMRHYQIPLMVEATHRIHLEDQRGAIPMVNVLPIYGTLQASEPNVTYDEYLDDYVTEVAPALLTYAHYSPMSDGTDRKSHYENMEKIRARALAADIGFMGFALVNDHFSYRLPSESDLRWQVYSLITYGAQGIWYYNYRIEPANGFGEGLVTHLGGTPTTTYPMAAAINAELHNLAPVLMSLQSTAVYHTDRATDPNTALYSDGVIDVMSTFAGEDNEFMLGVFENQDDAGDDDTYVMVMNKGHSGSTTSAQEANDASFTANPTTLNVYQYDPATGTPQLLTGSGGSYTLTDIGGGQGILLRFSTD